PGADRLDPTEARRNRADVARDVEGQRDVGPGPDGALLRRELGVDVVAEMTEPAQERRRDELDRGEALAQGRDDRLVDVGGISDHHRRPDAATSRARRARASGTPSSGTAARTVFQRGSSSMVKSHARTLAAIAGWVGPGSMPVAAKTRQSYVRHVRGRWS